MFQHPLSFAEKVEHEGYRIEYRNLLEVCQGGPVVGDLCINGVPLSGKKFGGPLLVNGKNVVIPLFERHFWRSGFVIAVIDLDTLIVKKIGRLNPVIYLHQVKKSQLYYYQDLTRTKLAVLDLVSVPH